MNSELRTPNTKKGLFIMLEGTDGSGKTTQTELLLNKLKAEGHDVEQISFPQYGEKSAALVEDYLNGTFGTADEVGPYRASILYAVDRYAAKAKIEGWLNAGKIVIANRYVASNMGHQGGKISDPTERQKYFDWNYHLEYTVFDIPRPDINIILHVTPEISQKLVDKKDERAYLTEGKTRDIHEDDLNHLRNAERAYLDIAKQFPEFTLIECVEGDDILPQKIIHEKIWEQISIHVS
ncbi:MAG: thymidylate kinase [Candidatus Magasanikbacteria bacterium CG_4_9_14_0_2_um_filter_42_11]|uniref:Thymidylate kinase n=1 Tax=Candidatus Magasanikbacteria bacterium CG_4_9_14_0_2_um_filter_42_11 TaxID=1974643 RepID=A0A2M8F9T9_9BACT|nr:MAG: thymidylate kinase [Candidatus Magasanikbacteria bacterium CG10_big_fil_rev_8_21_14_0_10_43_9]PIY92827.1 MAG: thymidylate kinase [Candidatus Magasanikbacteria bacterium CG_4_10_14_0_8_um_filter_42_12]PJC52502.1 MAG: thymidylate kinase [Candidatus Magasanikbacteria bacterium CG_4_9_14_0_2_um_filter_42_11]